MRSLVLKVDVLPGSMIHNVMTDLCELALKTSLTCEAKVNGIKVFAFPGDKPAELLDAFSKAMASSCESLVAMVKR